MPYNIRKQKCKRSDGTRGSYVMYYTDKKGKKRTNCHISKTMAKKQISAIEIGESTVREMIAMILGEFDGYPETGFEVIKGYDSCDE